LFRDTRLAIVAAVDAVSDKGSKTFRNASLELDGQVGNAAACVELVGRHDCSRRAGVETGAARSAVRADGRRDRQWQIGVDLAQKKERSRVAGEQQGVFPTPAQPCLRCQRDLEHRSAVGEDAVAIAGGWGPG
jgi:hypothetical protein